MPDIKTAISRAGATGVEISEGTKFALGRVMDGEVPAGIISLASPEEAAQWTGAPGYTVLKLPLARVKGSPEYAPRYSQPNLRNHFFSHDRLCWSRFRTTAVDNGRLVTAAGGRLGTVHLIPVADP